ncbi:hypothetical protein KAS08_00770 [Candidatus Pacearchaeota archaeon]|nr:hypothetical protein [Candidatus Pacearchaeota archaeon]
MEKNIGEIKKSDDTKIMVIVDDFGGFPGLTIREFVQNKRYTGFTKAGVRIRADKFEAFKAMINAVDLSDLKTAPVVVETKAEPSEIDSDEAGIDNDGFM